jgi:hypothetical protein
MVFIQTQAENVFDFQFEKYQKVQTIVYVTVQSCLIIYIGIMALFFFHLRSIFDIDSMVRSLMVCG